MAVLKFFGPFYGKVALAVDVDMKDSVTDFILSAFGAPPDTPADIVHTEILNIFSGNMITELTRRNLLMNISPPRPVDELSLRESYVEAVLVTTQNNLEIKFYLILDDAEQDQITEDEERSND